MFVKDYSVKPVGSRANTQRSHFPVQLHTASQDVMLDERLYFLTWRFCSIFFVTWPPPPKSCAAPCSLDSPVVSILFRQPSCLSTGLGLRALPLNGTYLFSICLQWPPMCLSMAWQQKIVSWPCTQRTMLYPLRTVHSRCAVPMRWDVGAPAVTLVPGLPLVSHISALSPSELTLGVTSVPINVNGATRSAVTTHHESSGSQLQSPNVTHASEDASGVVCASG